MLNEISQTQKDKCCMIHFGWGQIHRDRKQIVVSRDWAIGDKGELQVFIWDDEKVLEMDDSNGCTIK